MRVRRFDREAVASVYLSGSGIEIGALHNPLRVPLSAKVHYLDLMSEEELHKQYPYLKSKLVHVDIIDNGETLKTVENGSQDFVIANHFLEHCEDPIRAVVNIVRVLRDNCVMFLCIPDKRYTFDKEREVTSFDHLVHDYEYGSILSRNDHLRDFVINVEHKKIEAEIHQRMSELTSMNYSIHYHVWELKDMLSFFELLNARIGLPIEIELFSKNKAEAIFVIKKQLGSHFECV